jgi:transcriptional regulator with XRE-family HTH domain
MRFERSKEWWLSRSRAEPDMPISAGMAVPDSEDVHPLGAKCPPEAADAEMPARFSEFVHLLRRRQGLSIEEFADKVNIDVQEAQVLEEDAFYCPEPRTIFYISKAFNLSQSALNEYVGLTIANDFEGVEGQQRFAARSESRTHLDSEELALLNAIVAALENRAAKVQT